MTPAILFGPLSAFVAIDFLRHDVFEAQGIAWRRGVVEALVQAGVERAEAEARGDELLDENREARLSWRGCGEVLS